MALDVSDQPIAMPLRQLDWNVDLATCRRSMNPRQRHHIWRGGIPRWASMGEKWYNLHFKDGIGLNGNLSRTP